MKKIILTLSSLMLMAVLVSTTVFAYNPNYGESIERFQYFYNGYVQCQPSYNDGGYHATRSYLRYENGMWGDTGRLYTSYGRSPEDSRIYSRSKTYDDSLNPWAPVVEFDYGFDYVPYGSGAWPLSIPVGDI